MASLDPDLIVDRRRIKRRLTAWRFLAVVFFVAAVVAFALAAGDGDLPFARKNHIAAIEISGLIGSGDRQAKLIERIGEAKSAKALVVRINSPGGTTAGSEAIYEAIRELSTDKPVVAAMGAVAASGGYIVALATDRIFARGNTITGSIGVLFQWAEVNDALTSLGIKVGEIKSDPLKAAPSLFTPASDEARAVAQEMVGDTHAWFLRLVSERRGLDPARTRVLGNGRVYTGRQALDARLIDGIGGEKEAKAWLVEAKGIDKDLDIVEWEDESITGLSIPTRIASWIAGAFGLESVIGRIGSGFAAPRQRLDGLLSVWHPELDQ